MKDMNRNKLYKQWLHIPSLVLMISIILLITVQAVGADQILVSTNRYVVLDDPNTGTASSGFSNPNRNWGSTYWSGESTTIRAIALVTNNTGSPKSGVTVNFRLINPGGGNPVNTASNITNADGIAYYSYDLNTKNYWGYWKIEANITGTTNSTPFVLNWWGCPSCHGSKSLSTTTHIPKSYYAMGYNFHNANLASRHNDTMSAGDCLTCHKSYNITPDWHTGKVACIDCHINSTMQGRYPEIAGCYDTSGCHAIKNTNLKEINSTTGYIVGGNYRTKYSAIPTNSTKAHTTTSVECIACHGPGHNIEKPYNASISSNSITENEQCWTCHTNRATNHKSNTNCVGCHSQDAHNVSITGGGGGPDCISCHNIIGGSAVHKIDISAINLGEHANLNSGATATVDPANKKCWGCHQTGGTQPTDMGDRYTNPYKCYDCHNATKPYSNVAGALTVSEHFKNGVEIKAATSAVDNSTSCLTCHNSAEMKVLYTDNEFTDFSLASHYGKNRSELRVSGSTNCTYCHQNGSTIFVNAMSNVDNNNMQNHSLSINTPTCTDATCHNSGKLHDSTLAKPTDSSDTYCKNCHVAKNEHKTLYCTECHANNTDGSKAGRDIHGIKYLEKDNTFSQAKSGSVDCTTCHQSNTVDSSLGTFTPEKIGQLHHSNNITNGTRWGNYWASNIEACLYCHNDTKHSATPLGRPLTWNSSYQMRTTIGSGTNCADCHYQGDINYGGMSSAFTSIGYNIPPDITSGSWNGKPGYFNHTLADYTDLTCKGCHNQGGGASTVGQIMHNATEGSGGGGGGDDCIGCHTLQQGIYPGIDTASFTNHSNVNTSDGNNNITNRDCKTCHYDISNMFAGGWTTPTKTCNDCHTVVGGAPIIENHRSNDSTTVNITTTVDCSKCHNNSIVRYSYSANASTSHYATKTGLVSTKDCLYCHKNSVNGNYWGGANNPENSPTFPHSLSTTTKEECYSCHGDISASDFHNKTLKKPPLSSVTCLDCHKLNINMSKTKIDQNVLSSAVHKDKVCGDCHTGATVGNMNTYTIVANQPVSCTVCHTNLEHQPAGQDIKTPINCKDCHNNNGMYFNNAGTNGTENAVAHYLKNVTDKTTTPYGHTGPINTANCIDCHNGPYTNDPAWGSPVNISTSTKRVHTETTTSECDNCHKDGSVSTLANVDFHSSAIKLGAGQGDNCLDCHISAY